MGHIVTKLQRERARDLPVCCAEALERDCPDEHVGTHRCEYCGGLLTFLAGEWRPTSNPAWPSKDAC